jgi:hypothetical protein
MDQMLFSSAWFPSPEFERLLNRGFELKQDSRTTEADVDRFEQELSAANMEEQLAWLGPCSERFASIEQNVLQTPLSIARKPTRLVNIGQGATSTVW